MTEWTVKEIYEPQPADDSPNGSPTDGGTTTDNADTDAALVRTSTPSHSNPMRISMLADCDKPRERLLTKGARALSKAELLAILIGSGTKKESAVQLMQRILKDCGGSLKKLSALSADQLMAYNGIGEAKAVTILAACELGRQREKEREGDAPEILNSPDLIYEHIIHDVKDNTTEDAYAIFLNQACRHIKTVHISHGGLTETAIDVRVLMKEAILCNATVMVLIHNHPSGNTRPSREDDNVTKRVKAACETMRIHFMDHIIVAESGFYSYCNEGRL